LGVLRAVPTRVIASAAKQSSFAIVRRVRAQAATFRLPFANRRSSHHKHVKDDHGRETSDYRPDAERPKDVFGAEALLVSQFVSAGESLLLRKCSVLIVHDAPASCFVRMTLALLF
jgi:hypothetical protein